MKSFSHAVFSDIENVVSEVFEIPDIKNKCHKRDITDSKKVFAYMCYRYTTATHESIANYIGINRTTIHYYFKNMPVSDGNFSHKLTMCIKRWELISNLS